MLLLSLSPLPRFLLEWILRRDGLVSPTSMNKEIEQLTYMLDSTLKLFGQSGLQPMKKLLSSRRLPRFSPTECWGGPKDCKLSRVVMFYMAFGFSAILIIIILEICQWLNSILPWSFLGNFIPFGNISILTCSSNLKPFLLLLCIWSAEVSYQVSQKFSYSVPLFISIHVFHVNFWYH